MQVVQPYPRDQQECEIKLGNVWLGLGVGDIDPEVGRFKAFIRAKFQWVRDWPTPLDASDIFSATLADIVSEMQARYGLPVSGIVNYALKVRSGFVTPPPAVKPMLFTVCGTGVPWWVGPDADVARAVEDRYRWQPVGYRAAPFPMWPSITEGRNELVRLIGSFAGPFSLIGYSQGAIVVGQTWKYDLLAANGVLHNRLGDVKKVVTFGNPMREEGAAFSDGVGQPARAFTAGILEDRIVNTPTFWRDYAHAGDLYSDCELDDEGEYKRAICKIIMGNNVLTGSDSIIAQVLELSQRPIVEAIAAIKALIDAGRFFGSQTHDHVDYDPQAAIDFLRAS